MDEFDGGLLTTFDRCNAYAVQRCQCAVKRTHQGDKAQQGQRLRSCSKATFQMWKDQSHEGRAPSVDNWHRRLWRYASSREIAKHRAKWKALHKVECDKSNLDLPPFQLIRSVHDSVGLLGRFLRVKTFCCDTNTMSPEGKRKVGRIFECDIVSYGCGHRSQSQLPHTI